MVDQQQRTTCVGTARTKTIRNEQSCQDDGYTVLSIFDKAIRIAALG